jgi:hypothetical protein
MYAFMQNGNKGNAKKNSARGYDTVDRGILYSQCAKKVGKDGLDRLPKNEDESCAHCGQDPLGYLVPSRFQRIAVHVGFRQYASWFHEEPAQGTLVGLPNGLELSCPAEAG